MEVVLFKKDIEKLILSEEDFVEINRPGEKSIELYLHISNAGSDYFEENIKCPVDVEINELSDAIHLTLHVELKNYKKIIRNELNLAKLLLSNVHGYEKGGPWSFDKNIKFLIKD